MAVGFGVSVVVRGQTVDPAEMLSDVAAVVDARGIEVLSVGDVVRFTAAQVGELAVLAAPLAAWWQRYHPTTAGDVALRFVGPYGVNELTYCAPELVVGHIGHTIEVESGRVYEPGEAPGPLRRLAARLLRYIRTGFTASELVVRHEDEVLWVGLAGRELDDNPRSVEFQAYNADHEEYDADDDDGYCLVNEDHVPIYGGLVSLHLRGQRLTMRLTGEAARLWGLRSTTMTVKLRLSVDDIEQLRSELRRVFESGRTDKPVQLDLG